MPCALTSNHGTFSALAWSCSCTRTTLTRAAKYDRQGNRTPNAGPLRAHSTTRPRPVVLHGFEPEHRHAQGLSSWLGRTSRSHAWTSLALRSRRVRQTGSCGRTVRVRSVCLVTTHARQPVPIRTGGGIEPPADPQGSTCRQTQSGHTRACPMVGRRTSARTLSLRALGSTRVTLGAHT